MTLNIIFCCFTYISFISPIRCPSCKKNKKNSQNAGQTLVWSPTNIVGHFSTTKINSHWLTQEWPLKGLIDHWNKIMLIDLNGHKHTSGYVVHRMVLPAMPLRQPHLLFNVLRRFYGVNTVLWDYTCGELLGIQNVLLLWIKVFNYLYYTESSQTYITNIYNKHI